MQKIFTLLLLACFTFSNYLVGAERSHTTKFLSAKDGIVFKVLKKHGKLVFTFTPTPFFGFGTGHFQASILTPDKKRFTGPILDRAALPATFTIVVRHPILYGTYTVAIQNIDVVDFFGSLIEGFVAVSNPYNNKKVKLLVNQVFDPSTGPLPNLPGSFAEGYFIPYKKFIEEN